MPASENASLTSLLHLLRRPLLHVGAFSLLVNLLLLAPSIFMLQVFDRVLSSRSTDTLLVLGLGTAIALVLMGVLDHLRTRLQGVGGVLISDALTPAVTRFSVAEGARRQGRATAEGLRDVMSLRALFSAQGLVALFDAPWLLVYVGAIALVHPILGVSAACAALIMLGLAFLNDCWTRKDLEGLQKVAASATRYLETSLANAEVSQAMGMTEALIQRWRLRNAEVCALQVPTARKTMAMSAFTKAYRQAVQVAMLAIGAALVIEGHVTPGAMIACTLLLGRALAPVEQIVASWKVLAEGRCAWKRLAALLEAQETQPPRMPLPEPRGSVGVHQVVYRASGTDRVLLAGVSLELEPGESVAIIGPSGAGKSTLVRLLTGVWQPTAGTVRLDGADLSQWDRQHLGPWIGYVPQDVELFPGTVADNIARLGEVDSEKVVAAARAAGTHELILALPQGYDTPVDPHGAVVSPGQRQRLALARALYGEPTLIVLDEPNANLDGAGESALAETLRRLRGKATVVVVTHRQSLVQHVDKLLVLEAGKVTHWGKTADVLGRLRQPAPDAAPPGPSAPPKPAREASTAEACA